MEEIDDWKNFQEVANESQCIVFVKCVETKKNKSNGTVHKVKLVAWGFEETEKDSIRKDSPTYCKENFGLILSIIFSLNLKVYSLGTKSAFLQGQTIKRNVFIKPPSETIIDTNNCTIA